MSTDHASPSCRDDDRRSCPRCETVPPAPGSSGRLFLSPPLGHTGGKITRVLENADIPFGRRGDDGHVLAVELVPGRLTDVVEHVDPVLQPNERTDLTVLLLEEEREPRIEDIMGAAPWPQLATRVQESWLFELLREGRLETHFQPIVHTDEPDRIFGYECLLRGRDRDDSIVSPGRMFEAARPADLLFQLDRDARISAIRSAHSRIPESSIFINFMPTSIYDPVYCLRTTVQAAEEAGIAPERVVFEVVESEEIEDRDSLLDIVDYYRESGFRVALDDLGAGYGSLSLLTALRPDVVKLDLELVRDVHREPYKSAITSALLELARDLGVTTVAEGVESEDEWRWLRDAGADLVSGYYFARPEKEPPLP